MLNKPIHALCENRSTLSLTGKMQNIVDSFFSDTRLKKIGLSSIDFDFFINWEDNSISNEIWIKRIIDNNEILSNVSKDDIGSAIKSVDTPLYIKSLIEFADREKFSLKYKLFHDKSINDWDNCKLTKSLAILEIELNKSGLTNLKSQSVDILMSQIQLLSGGPMEIGEKGLRYSTSALECYLSKSNAPWPGDADRIIMDAVKMEPLVLIELKKHTLVNETIEEHTYERYYRNKDFRKYHRLALLANHLQIPLVILYYSTKHENYILIDKLDIKVSGNYWDLSLKSRDKKTPPLNNLEYNQLIYSLIH